jgi:hypothetical protein
MTTVAEPDLVRVRFRSSAGSGESAVLLADISADRLVTADPWRTFRWRHGQRHYSGAYWSVTEDAHVIYESRLELTRLLYADFDPSVRRVVAQPFLLMANVSGVQRKHVPDYLLITDAGPVVVDVKPASKLTDPKVAHTLTWTRSAIGARGWTYQVWTEPPTAELRNIRFLAGFRRPAHFDDGLLCELKAAGLDNMGLGEASRSVVGRPTAVVRSALLHLVWLRYFDVDITSELTPQHLLLPGACR